MGNKYYHPSPFLLVVMLSSCLFPVRLKHILQLAIIRQTGLAAVALSVLGTCFRTRPLLPPCSALGTP